MDGRKVVAWLLALFLCFSQAQQTKRRHKVKRITDLIKAHKIITALVVVVILIIAVSTSSGSNPASTSSKQAAAKVAQVPANPPYPYSTLLNNYPSPLAQLNATISPSENNKTDLPALCKYFSEQAAAKPKEYYTVIMLDDPSFTQSELDQVVNGTASDALNNDYDLHFVLSYNFNPTTHNNVCNIQYGGDNDSSPSDNQSISY